MAHNLEQQPDGNYSFVSARTPGWHHLGKTYYDLDGMTLDTVLDDIDAGEIVTAPVFSYVGGTAVSMPGKKMVSRVRTSGVTPLGIVGEDRPIVPEREAFGFLQAMVDSGDALIQTAGLLGNGERAFMCMKMPEGVLIGGVDPVDLYLMCVLSHDASLSFTGAATPIRTECQNTITLGLQQAKQTWKIRHSKHMKLDVAKAREQLKLTFDYVDEWSTAMEKLIQVEMTNNQFDQIVRGLYAPDIAGKSEKGEKYLATVFEERRERLNFLFAKADTQASIRGTAYAGLQALVEDLDWHTSTRNVAEADKEAYMFERSVTQGATQEKTQVFETVMAFAG